MSKGSPYSKEKKYQARNAPKPPVKQVKPRFPSIKESHTGEVHIQAEDIQRKDDDAYNKATKAKPRLR